MNWTKSNGTLAARIYERLSKRNRRRWWWQGTRANSYRSGYLAGMNQTLEAIQQAGDPVINRNLFEVRG